MKKVIVALLIAMIIPASVFAARGMFDLTVGVTAESTYDVQKVQDAINNGTDFEFSMDDLGFGADIEAKVAFLAVDARGVYAPAQKTISGIVSANLALDIFFVRVKAGLGYEYNYNLESQKLYFGTGTDITDDFNQFKTAAFDACLGVDVLLGNLTIGAHASLPTGVTVDKNNWGDLVSTIQDNWQYAKLGVTVGIALI